MGAVVKLIDATIFLFLVVIVVGAPLIDSQICLPPSIFPNFLIDLKNWYTSEFGDYFFTNTPHFFVGMVWLQLLFQWPLALLNLYGILGSKSWFKTTCLMYGVSVISTMVKFSYSIISLMRLFLLVIFIVGIFIYWEWLLCKDSWDSNSLSTMSLVDRYHMETHSENRCMSMIFWFCFFYFLPL